MKRHAFGLAAALLASGGVLILPPSHSLSQESAKTEKASSGPATGKLDDAGKSHLRSGREAIDKALVEKTELDLKELTLDEAIRRIRMKHHVQIQFDFNALKDAAIDPTTLSITLQVQGISLKSALKLMLSQFSLTTVVEDEVLKITTKDAANVKLRTQVYDIHDVLRHSGPKNEPDFDSLIDLITNTLATQSWSAVGGPGAIDAFQPAMLVISQTNEVHEQIEPLLAAIRKAAAQMQAGKFEEIDPTDSSDAEKAIAKSLLVR